MEKDTHSAAQENKTSFAKTMDAFGLGQDTPERGHQKRSSQSEQENEETKFRSEAGPSVQHPEAGPSVHASKFEEILEMMRIQMVQTQEFQKTIALQSQAAFAMAEAVTKAISKAPATPTPSTTPPMNDNKTKNEEKLRLDKENRMK